MEPLILTAGGLLGLALGSALLSFASGWSQRAHPLQARLQGAMAAAPAHIDSMQSSSLSLWARLLAPLALLSKPKEQSEDFSRSKQQLSWAGIRHPRGVELLYGAKLAFALALGGAVLALNALRAESLPRVQMIAVLATAIGFYGPSIWLSGRVAQRQQAISRTLPDALDLLVTCVEAGLGLEAALLRITQEIGLSAPELAYELRLTTGEMQAGMRRASAFRRLAERTGLEELRTLSAMLIQTEMFGTSIAQALRVHASSMRTRRTHRAEEKAATVSVKMLVPLILFILPSLFAVILGPAVVRIVTTLIPTLGGK